MRGLIVPAYGSECFHRISIDYEELKAPSPAFTWAECHIFLKVPVFLTIFLGSQHHEDMSFAEDPSFSPSEILRLYVNGNDRCYDSRNVCRILKFTYLHSCWNIPQVFEQSAFQPSPIIEDKTTIKSQRSSCSTCSGSVYSEKDVQLDLTDCSGVFTPE